MASIRAEVAVYLPLETRKRLAAVGMIRQLAQQIAEEQPWNEDAKAIKKLANRLVRSVEVRKRK